LKISYLPIQEEKSFKKILQVDVN